MRGNCLVLSLIASGIAVLLSNNKRVSVVAVVGISRPRARGSVLHDDSRSCPVTQAQRADCRFVSVVPSRVERNDSQWMKPTH